MLGALSIPIILGTTVPRDTRNALMHVLPLAGHKYALPLFHLFIAFLGIGLFLLPSLVDRYNSPLLKHTLHCLLSITMLPPETAKYAQDEKFRSVTN
jgi:hypothetical protein